MFNMLFLNFHNQTFNPPLKKPFFRTNPLSPTPTARYSSLMASKPGLSLESSSSSSLPLFSMLPQQERAAVPSPMTTNPFLSNSSLSLAAHQVEIFLGITMRSESGCKHRARAINMNNCSQLCSSI